MKRKFCFTVLPVIVLSLMLYSCKDRKSHTGDALPHVPAVLPTEIDSVVFRMPEYTYYLSAEFPSDTSSLLAHAIGEYFNEALGGSYNGKVTDFRGLLEFYSTLAKAEADTLMSELGNDEIYGDWFSKSAFSKYSENPNYVSYIVEGASYTGGAHGSTGVGGATFRKTDGRRIDWDVFRDARLGALCDVIKKGLMEYWEISDERDLKSCFLDEGDYYDCPLPAVGPIFTDKGVEFIYNQYEIAAYALGIPRFVVPYGELEQYMMTSAKELVWGSEKN